MTVTYQKVCAYCGEEFLAKRDHAVCCSDACRYQLHLQGKGDGAQAPAQRVEPGAAHPLEDARAEQEQSEANRRFGFLIRQAIIDQLRTKREVHADDLEPLYPANDLDRRRCRKLAGAQFGSLAAPRGDSEPLIREKERRKSTIPQRKGAKSGVYVFTKAGWDKYATAGLGAGSSLGGSASVESGERDEGSRDQAEPQTYQPVDATSSATPPKPNPSSSDTSSAGGDEVRLFDLDQARERPRSALTDPRAA